MNQILPPASPMELTGLPRAVDGPETTLGGLAAASFDREAIDRNYWWLREGRTSENEQAMLDDVSIAVYGRPAAWLEGQPEPPAFNGVITTDDMAAQSDAITRTRDEKIDEMFDRLDVLREFDPGTFANAPGSIAELRDRALERTRIDLQQESDEIDRTIANRSDPTIAGGVASFVGAAGAAISDAEGIATLPLGAGGRVSLARRMLIEGAIGAGEEAATLPAYNRQAEFLGRDAPDPLAQILFGATFGAALPLAGRGVVVGANSLTPAGRVRNRDLIGFGRRSDATPRQRGAANELAREAAAEDVAPEGTNPADHVARIDEAEAQIDAGNVAPASDPADVPEGVRPLLNFINSAEAPQGYNQVYSGSRLAPPRPITSMTINEVLSWQDASVRAGSVSSAAGAYQIIRKTLRRLVTTLRLTGEELFDGAMQDRLAVALMREKGLDDYLSGKISATTFGNRLAGVWAGLPEISGSNRGRSVYDGFAGNQSTVSVADFMEALQGRGVDGSIASGPASYYGPRAVGLGNFSTPNAPLDAPEIAFRQSWTPAPTLVPDNMFNAAHYADIIARAAPQAPDVHAAYADALTRANPANHLQAEIITADLHRRALASTADGKALALPQLKKPEIAEIKARAEVVERAIDQLKNDQPAFAALSGNVGGLQSPVLRPAEARAVGRVIELAGSDKKLDAAITRAAKPAKGKQLAKSSAALTKAIRTADQAQTAPASAQLEMEFGADSAVGPALRDPELFDDPVQGRGAQMQVEMIERDLRIQLDAHPDADLEIVITEGDNPVKARISEILDDIEDEQNFFEELNLCMPKGATNG